MNSRFSPALVASLSFALLGGGTWFARSLRAPGLARAPASASDAAELEEGFPDTLRGIDESKISVKSATWSGKDVTDVAAKFCDGKSSCDYKISTVYLGKAADAKDLGFSIEWSCSDSSGETRKHEVRHDASNQHVLLLCPLGAIPPNAVAVGAGSARADGITEAYHSPHSFRAMFLADEGKVGRAFSARCRRLIQGIYDKGETLAIKFPEEQVRTVENETYRSSVDDRIFYHYTKASAVREIAGRQAIEEIQAFVRNAYGAFNRFFFVAEDPDSTRDKGGIQVKVTLRPGARIYELGKGYENAKRGLSLVTNALRERFPGIEDCHEDLTSSVYISGTLLSLALEDSDIDLIDYTNHYWYQLLNPYAVERMEAK